MGVLRVRVDGQWVDVGSGQQEVAVQADDPGGAFDLWYDTDAVPLTLASTVLRPFAGVVPTDANAYASIAAAQFGLTAIAGGLAACATLGDSAWTNLVTECSVVGTNLRVRLAAMNITSNDVVFNPNSGGIAVYAVAWGTPA